MQTHRRGPLRHARDPKLGSRQIGQVKVPSVDAAEALSQAEQHGPALRDRRQRGANGAGRLAVMLGAAPLPVTAVLSPPRPAYGAAKEARPGRAGSYRCNHGRLPYGGRASMRPAPVGRDHNNHDCRSSESIDASMRPAPVGRDHIHQRASEWPWYPSFNEARPGRAGSFGLLRSAARAVFWSLQ